MTQFRNLVFKGGGVKGIAYIGAISVLEESGVVESVGRVCGTSSGAIMAAHLALGGKAQQLATMMTSRFLKGLLGANAWAVAGFASLITEYGWFNGKRMSMWLKRHVEDLSGESGLTFGRLSELARLHPRRFKELSVVATDVLRQCPQVFDARETPGVLVCEALRASMSIPFLFSAAKLGEEGLYVDGGLTWNYPLSLYDDGRWLSDGHDSRLYDMIAHPSDSNTSRFYNKETLGLMVETRSMKDRMEELAMLGDRDIGSFPSYLRAMLGLLTDVSAGGFLNLPDWQRTMFIEAGGVRATDFGLPDEGIEALLESGRKAARAYLDWFEDPGNKPFNRIGSTYGTA